MQPHQRRGSWKIPALLNGELYVETALGEVSFAKLTQMNVYVR